MRRISIPRNWSDITIEPARRSTTACAWWSADPPRPDKLAIGVGTYVNRYTILDAHERLHIGRDVMIGPHCYVTDADHGTDAGAAVQAQPMRHRPVVIEDEAWLGAHVAVLPGSVSAKARWSAPARW